MNIYLLALIPSERLQQEIMVFKEEIKEKYGAKHALKLPAHITLHKPFKIIKEDEGNLIQSLNNFSGEQQPFNLHLSNFGKFEQRVIFVNVENKEPVTELAYRLQRGVSSFIDTSGELEKFHPHLTIATRDLNRKMFHEAWNTFRNRSYSAVFEVRKISLLKHENEKWNVVKEFSMEIM